MNCNPDFGARKWIELALRARFEIFVRDGTPLRLTGQTD